jgi:hypothetical protein
MFMQRFTRRPKYALAAAAGVLAALGAVTGLTQAQTTSKATTRNVTCSESLVATKAGSDNSEGFGTITCSTSFGKGVRHDTATLAAPTKTAGAYSGGVKLFFNTGTLRGSYHLNFTIADKTVTYDGTLKITSGTGEFAGVSGTGTTAGTSSDAVHSSITEKLTLKIPAKKKTSS